MHSSAAKLSRTRHGVPLSPTARLTEWLGNISDAALATIILVAPLFMGCRGPVGRFVLVLLVSVAAMAWLVRMCLLESPRWRWSGAEPVLLLGAMLVLLQLISLPPGLLSRLSPAIPELLPLWGGEETSFQLGQWSTVSLSPERTRAGLAIYLTYVLLFVLVVQRIEALRDITRIFRWVAVAAMGMAVLGLVQYLFGNGKFLWVYEHPSRATWDAVKGTFQNQNHFSHFLALGLGPILYWLWETGRNWSGGSTFKKKFSSGRGSRGKAAWIGSALLIGLTLLGAAVLLTYSRGGIVILAVTMMAGMLAYGWQGLLDRRVAGIMLGAAVVVLVALAIYGGATVSHELGTLYRAGSMGEVSVGRVALWKAICEGIPKFALLGSGVGSQCDVYPIFMEEYFNMRFSHGESGYLPLALETGLAGFVLLLAGIGISLRWCLATFWSYRAAVVGSGSPPGGELRALAATACAVFACWVASVVHSLFDFVWYIPACVSVTVVLLACGCRAFQLYRERGVEAESPGEEIRIAGSTPLRRTACLVVVLVSSLVSVAAIQCHWRPALAAPSWEAYMRLARHMGIAQPQTADDHDRLWRMHQHLARSLLQNPRDARAQLQMAALCLRQFDVEQQNSVNPMGLAQIRDAALASAFPSRKELDEWLTVAIGENRQLLDLALWHCRRAVQLAPLQGTGYVYLSELSFLESSNPASKQELIQQAARVRPHSGLVHYALGQEAALSGNLTAAIAHCRKAFQLDPEVQKLIINSFAPQLSAEGFLATFEADCTVLGQLVDHYRSAGRQADARHATREWIEQLTDKSDHLKPLDAANQWYRASLASTWLGDSQQALACALAAVERAPSDMGMRRSLAQLLVQNQRYAEAVEHLNWLLRRNPRDESLRAELAQAKLCLDQLPRTANHHSPNQVGIQH